MPSLGDYDDNNDLKRPPPIAGVFDEPTVMVLINVEWIPHVTGLLYELTDESIWLGTDLEREQAVAQVIRLLSLFDNRVARFEVAKFDQSTFA